MLGSVNGRRSELLARLEDYYRSCGWQVVRASDGTVRATGTGGVTWIALAVVADDVRAPECPERLRELSEQRMPDGSERCPFELLPDAACEAEVRGVLSDLRLADRVSVYSLAA